MIKTTEESKSFKVYGSTAAQIALKNESGATNTRFFIHTYDLPTGTSKFSVDTFGKVTSASSFNGTAFNVVSLRETKKNIKPSSIDALKALDWLNPVEFNYKTEADNCKKHHGLIADCIEGTPASSILSENELGQSQGIDIVNLLSLHTSALKMLKENLKDGNQPEVQNSLKALTKSHNSLASTVADQNICISNLHNRIKINETQHVIDLSSLQAKVAELQAKIDTEILLLKKTLANAKVDLKM